MEDSNEMLATLQSEKERIDKIIDKLKELDKEPDTKE